MSKSNGVGKLYDRLQEELEVEPEKVIKALFDPAMSRVEDLQSRKEKFGTAADKGRASEYAAAFSEAWRRHLKEAKRLSR